MDIKSNWKKNAVLFIASQAVSLFGSMLVQYAITWFITLQTKSGLMMTISIICGFLPALFISPFAGVWADRYNRKTLIIFSDSLTAVSTLILALLFIMGHGSVWLLFAVSAIRSVGAGIQMPASGAFMPLLVPEDALTKVNGLNGSIQSLVSLVSPLLSGVLLSVAAIENIFFIDVVTAAVAIFILLVFLNVPLHAKAAEKQKINYFSDMRQGIDYIKNHSFLKTLFAFFTAFYVLAVPLAFLTSLQVTRNFGGDVWRLTAIEMAFSVGMTAGGIIIAVWGGFKNRLHTMTLSIIAIALCTVLLGLVGVFSVYVIIMVLCGLVMPIFNTPCTVLLQEKVEGDYLGRVFGIMSMISSSIMPLGMLFYGPLADYIRIEIMLVVTGALMLAEGFIMLRNRALLEAGKPVVKKGESL